MTTNKVGDTVIADHDAEDAYDATDPPAMQLDVLERIADELDDDPGEPRREFRRVDALRLVGNLERRPGVDLIRLAVVRHVLEEL